MRFTVAEKTRKKIKEDISSCFAGWNFHPASFCHKDLLLAKLYLLHSMGKGNGGMPYLEYHEDPGRRGGKEGLPRNETVFGKRPPLA